LARSQIRTDERQIACREFVVSGRDGRHCLIVLKNRSTRSSVALVIGPTPKSASKSLLELFDRPQKSKTVDDFEQAHGRF